MKMNFAIFFGLLVVLAGISIISSAVFGIHLPLMRTAFAALLIFFGIRILVDAWRPARVQSASGTAAFTDQRFVAPSDGESKLRYDVIFGRGVVDLTRLPVDKESQVEVNAVFGSAVVQVDPRMPIQIDGNAAFGGVRMPNDSATSFGDVHYRPPGQLNVPAKIHLRCSAVFGTCDVQQRATPRLEQPIESGAH